MATVEDECTAVPCRLLEVVQAEEGPSSFQNSCTGLQRFDSPESNGNSSRSSTSTEQIDHVLPRQPLAELKTRENILDADTNGWIKSLAKLPPFNHEKLENKLVKNSRTMPDKIAPKAHRNMKKGYGLWKEGYVKNTFVKPNVQASKLLFLVKARVSASMKSARYQVYVHLNQVNGEVEYAKCSCKAGQGGCCKHVAAVLYTILDFTNLNLQNIPVELTCTQLPQQWNVPAGSSKTLDKAVKFGDLSFEKIDMKKPNKRYTVKGNRENYCATPPFAQTIKREKIKAMADSFRKANRASLFCQALESNDFKPCELFETSCSQQKSKQQDERLPSQIQQVPENHQSLLIDKVFENVPKDYHPPTNYTPEQLEHAERTVGLTVSCAKEICLSTMGQNKNPRWYTERSKRVTASSFGNVINRRKSIYPNSLVKTITKQCINNPVAAVPKPLQWGLHNESKAILKYQEDVLKGDGVVRSCGFVVSPKWPWLGCSPDGVVVKDGVPVGCVEIKCPYASKDLNISEAVQNKKFFLKQTENGWKLKENHGYYNQCQGVMNILNLEWIDFVVYTNIDMHVERIYKDVSLWEKVMLPELTSFYFSFILPLNV